MPRKYLSLLSILTGGMLGLSKLQRFRPKTTFPNMILSGTLYVGSLRREWNAYQWLFGKYKSILKMKKNRLRGCNLIYCGSSTNIPINQDATIDYIFTDPPFGGNLMYSELNFLWESWLKVFTNNKPEAIENSIQGKGIKEYQVLMEQCFSECFRF